MKLLIAIPCMAQVDTKFLLSVLGLDIYGVGAINYSVSESSVIYDARNQLAKKAVEEEFDRVLWLDSDMVFAPDLMKRLNARLDEGYDVVTGLYFGRRDPIKPIVYKNVGITEKEDGTQIPFALPYEDYPAEEMFKVAGCGFGACMMNVSALRKVAETKGLPFSPILGFGEDLSFCLRATECGIDIMCDPTIKLGHVAHVTISEETYKEGVYRA